MRQMILKLWKIWTSVTVGSLYNLEYLGNRKENILITVKKIQSDSLNEWQAKQFIYLSHTLAVAEPGVPDRNRSQRIIIDHLGLK
jgi:hypothetical protein